MKAPRLLASIATAAISLALTTVPARSRETPIVDYCASKSTGNVRKVTKGLCTLSEISLGTQVISRQKNRPSDLVRQSLLQN